MPGAGGWPFWRSMPGAEGRHERRRGWQRRSCRPCRPCGLLSFPVLLGLGLSRRMHSLSLSPAARVPAELEGSTRAHAVSMAQQGFVTGGAHGVGRSLTQAGLNTSACRSACRSACLPNSVPRPTRPRLPAALDPTRHAACAAEGVPGGRRVVRCIVPRAAHLLLPGCDVLHGSPRPRPAPCRPRLAPGAAASRHPQRPAATCSEQTRPHWAAACSAATRLPPRA